jgi:prepilin-type N-terminal cleavage/methylation domain-containing protein/prepilin-type processing-associated H-X9-DG protein
MYLSRKNGFTLIELLVSITITTTLAMLLFLGVKSFIKAGQRAAEISAGKTLISAFHAYAADNNGKLLKAMDPNPGRIVDNTGKPVMSHAARRWPWRVAPYIGYDVNTLMVNNMKNVSIKDPMFSYYVSVFSTLGMNGLFVGGKYGTGMSPDNPRVVSRLGNFCVTTIAQPFKPSILIVFASGKMQGAPVQTPGIPLTGSFDITGPGIGAVGDVDYKYNDKAVVVYFDGHVELNTKEELRDMRRWSNLAAIQDNPNWNW